MGFLYISISVSPSTLDGLSAYQYFSFQDIPHLTPCIPAPEGTAVVNDTTWLGTDGRRRDQLSSSEFEAVGDMSKENVT